MHDHGRLSVARLLAPLALLVCATAFIAVVLGSGVIGDDAGDPAGVSDRSAATETTSTSTTRERKRRATYTIKANDTLTGIAEQTGTTVERLQELNPELDPQGLVAGQKIKLRE
jgi:LysM repeat protein